MLLSGKIDLTKYTPLFDAIVMRDLIYDAVKQCSCPWTPKGKPANEWTIGGGAVSTLRELSPKLFPSSVVLFIGNIKIEAKDESIVEGGSAAVDARWFHTEAALDVVQGLKDILQMRLSV